MKKIFTKQNVLPVVVLVVICVVTAALIGGINFFTEKEIEKNRLEAANAGKIEVLPTLDITTMEDISIKSGEYPDEVQSITRFDAGYVVETKVKGNASGMIVLVGLDNDGKITGVKVLENGETPTYWANVVNVVSGKDGKYNGQTPDTLQPELVSGATNSSKGVYSAVKASVDTFVILSGGEVEIEKYEPPKSLREDSELITLAGELVDGATGFTAVEFDAESYNAKYLARVFKENGGKGYVAYVVVMSSSYAGKVESETLIHIENNGKIKKVNKLACNISPANPQYGYTPPTSDEVDAFYGRLPQNNSQTIGSVELVTNATNTTTNVRDSVKEALVIVADLILKDMPTSEEDIIALAKEMVGADAEFTNITPEEKTFVRRIYRENNGKGYIAYLVVINDRYSRIETETLIYVGNDGKIKDYKKIIWKTSDAGWGYVPPTDDVINPFYESLKGKSLADLQELATLEEGAHGGQLVTNATTTSKALLNALIEGVAVIDEARKKDMPTGEEQLFDFAKDMIGADAEFTNITPDENTFVKRIYRENKGRGYIAYLVVINERYNRIETETLIYVGNDGKIKDYKKIIWKTSDAGWGYVPPTDDVVNPFYESLKGKALADLQALAALEEGAHGGQLVTNATTTSKALLAALIEGVTVIDEVRKKDMPRPEEEVVSLAQQMAGEGKTLNNITPGNVEFLKRLYRIDNTNSYIAYVVVINERYGRVETETMIYIGEDGKLKDINKLTWKTSDAGWGYVPPTDDVVNPFYESLKGKSLADLQALAALEDGAHGGQLVTNATTTSKALLGALIEAMESADANNLEVNEVVTDYTARVVGAVALSLISVAVVALIVLPKILTRRKNG